MDLHNKLTQDHFAWFDKEIRQRGTPKSEIKITPNNVERFIIASHQSENLTTQEMTLNDVIYDRDVISCEEWIKGKENGKV